MHPVFVEQHGFVHSWKGQEPRSAQPVQGQRGQGAVPMRGTPRGGTGGARVLGCPHRSKRRQGAALWYQRGFRASVVSMRASNLTAMWPVRAGLSNARRSLRRGRACSALRRMWFARFFWGRAAARCGAKHPWLFFRVARAPIADRSARRTSSSPNAGAAPSPFRSRRLRRPPVPVRPGRRPSR